MRIAAARWPDRIETEEQLDELLTRPGAALVRWSQTVSNPLLVLGAGGKMGPTLAVLAHRAAQAAGRRLDVIAVSRFSQKPARRWLEDRGVKTLSCDLLDARSLARLPETRNLIYLVGLKFGTAQNPAATWAINTLVPARVVERFPHARMVALSTGNVYPPSPARRGGALESAPLTPLGEYANAAVGRERIFQFCASDLAGARSPSSGAVALLRLFYAVELRYGVLPDIARKVQAGQPIDLANGWFNCIWQGDANDLILRSLSLAGSPPTVWNLCRPEVFSVREVSKRFGELLGRRVRFTGRQAPTALLGNASRLCARLGRPAVPLECMLRWVAHWVQQGGRDLARPTHFEVRDGNY